MRRYVYRRGKGFYPTKEMKKIANVNSEGIYKFAEKNPIRFWEILARAGINWEKEWKRGYKEKLPYFWWFLGGKLNFCVNCLDRHLGRVGRLALIFVPEPKKEKPRIYSYAELYEKVGKFSNALKRNGVKKGDVVSIYMPMIPETLIAMLACTRIGAIHSVVFSAFSSDALRTRIKDGEAKVLITADGYFRRGKREMLLERAKDAVKGTGVRKIFVVRRMGKEMRMGDGFLDFWEELNSSDSYCEPEIMNSEDVLFILYTSGTTGTPKGIVHDTGGYAVMTYWTTKWNFNLNEGDVMFCTADVGWITGHSYAFYGPLLVGATTLIYEGSPDFPNWGRWWEIIEEHNVNVLYTAPTAIRMFMRFGEKFIKKYDLSSLKILGTVGEPIDEESWMWYFKKVGRGRLPVIDTWWQTETGATLINSLPGIGPFIPTISGRSFPGVFHEVVNERGRKAKEGEVGFLVQKSPFAPGMLRGVYKNPKKYYETYWKRFKKMYDTGDEAYMKDGLIRITGRADDVIKVAGHRLSTAEIENAIHKNFFVNECAVVSKPDEIRGEVPVAFVVLTNGDGSKSLENKLVKSVVKKIGPIAKPRKIYFVDDLPKTRSGKIMRRVLKALLRNEEPRGLMTLVNPESVNGILKVISGQL